MTRTILASTAGLHERTVQRAPELIDSYAPAPAPRPKDRNGPVSVATVDRRVLAKALQLAGGDAARLHIQPDGSVIVANQ